MVTATAIQPQPSWNVQATPGPTDYSYVANVPPVAIGPMLKPGLRGFGLTEKEKRTRTTIISIGVALAIVGGGFVAWRTFKR